jgi:hypothetical protein
MNTVWALCSFVPSCLSGDSALQIALHRLPDRHFTCQRVELLFLGQPTDPEALLLYLRQRAR